MNLATTTGIPPRRIQATWLVTELNAAVALNQIKAKEDQIGMDSKAIQSLREHNIKLDRLHEEMLGELKLTRGQKRARAEEQKRIASELHRPTRTAAPVQPPTQQGAQAHAAPTKQAQPANRHYTKDGRLTLPPLPNFKPAGEK